MRQKTLLILALIILVCILVASVFVNYFYTGTFAPEKIVGSILSLP